MAHFLYLFFTVQIEFMHKKMTDNNGHYLVGKGGFEPPKSTTADLQSAPFGHSGTYPRGAGNKTRTYDLLITNQLLYQLSYAGGLATRKGLEPSTSSVTGWHSNQLNYLAKWWAFRDSNPGQTGYEPVALTN